MIDPSVDAAALFNIAKSKQLLTRDILVSLSTHPSCYPELYEWATNELSNGPTTAPVPEPPTLEKKGGRQPWKKEPRLPEPSKPSRRRRNRRNGTPWVTVAVGGLVLAGLAGAGGYTLAGASSTSAVSPTTNATQPAEGAPDPAAAAATPTEVAISMSVSGESFFCEGSGTSITCTGANTYGQLGIDTATSAGSNTIELPAPVTHLVAGKDHVCAASEEGVLCWGDNRWQQTAQPAGSPETPASVPELVGEAITGLWAGEAFTCAATTSSVWCWGANGWGQLGLGTTSDATTPKEVQFGFETEITGLTGTRFSTCATLSTEDKPWCWGSNIGGNILPGDSRDVLGPTPLGGTA